MASILPVLTLTPKTDSVIDTITESFVFEGYEEPEMVNFGKEQSSYKHILIGGGRVIDMMGAGDPDITWSGYFTGFQAPFRARYLETLCKKGEPLTLRTNAFVKEVVITKITFGQREILPIPYTISLLVIEDKTMPVNFAIPANLTITVLEYLFQAEAISAAIANGGLTAALSAAIAAAQAASPFDTASNADIQAALAAAQNANLITGQLIGQTTSSIFGSPSKNTFESSIVTIDPNKFITQSENLDNLNNLFDIQNILNAYVIKNLLLVNQSEQARAITYINPNLYSIAVQYYGDVNYWTTIANANNLTDTQFDGAITLLIPPKPSFDSGSILNPNYSTSLN